MDWPEARARDATLPPKPARGSWQGECDAAVEKAELISSGEQTGLLGQAFDRGRDGRGATSCAETTGAEVGQRAPR